MYVNELVRATAENVAEGDSLPLAVLPAAIPYFSVRLSALCVEKRELNVLQEYILRAVELGLSGGHSIGGFLGTRDEEVSEELTTLVQEYFVSRKPEDGSHILTEKGIAAISQTGLRRVVEREAACYVNGVTRGVEQVNERLNPRRRVPDGTVFLPAIPARPPKIAELDIGGVRASMLTARSPLPRALEITRLGRIVRTSSLFLGGYLLLRRGRHGVPAICAQGSQSSELARLLGGHPAIENIKGSLEADEKRARSFVRKHAIRSVNIALADASVARDALTRLVAYADAPSNEVTDKKREFLQAMAPLLNDTHWIAAVEWHLLFAKLTFEVSERLLLVAPRLGPLFGLDELDHLGGLASRGIDVEVIMSAEQAASLVRHDRAFEAFRRLKLTSVQGMGDVCGFCTDGKHLVIAVARDNSSSMGHYDSLFGAYIAMASDPDELLRSCAESSGWAVGLGRNNTNGAIATMPDQREGN